MRLITTSSALEKAFERLLVEHEKLSFAVAWASHGFPGFNELLKHEGRIKQGIVGTHFYQTHPSFIEHFLSDNRIKFVKDTSGVFHPKFYLFETLPSQWSCLIGSANFTGAAFSTNTEACLLFEAADDAFGATRRRHGLATATRLLAMKRPDYFVCFDAQNRDGLCKAFGIKLGHHDYEEYWDSVVERIFISEWWRSPRPAGARARAIWDGRAAFLDSLYYKPKPKK